MDILDALLAMFDDHPRPWSWRAASLPEHGPRFSLVDARGRDVSDGYDIESDSVLRFLGALGGAGIEENA